MKEKIQSIVQKKGDDEAFAYEMWFAYATYISPPKPESEFECFYPSTTSVDTVIMHHFPSTETLLEEYEVTLTEKQKGAIQELAQKLFFGIEYKDLHDMLVGSMHGQGLSFKDDEIVRVLSSEKRGSLLGTRYIFQQAAIRGCVEACVRL